LPQAQAERMGQALAVVRLRVTGSKR